MTNLLQMVKGNDLLKVALVLAAVYLFVKFFRREQLENTAAESGAPAPEEEPAAAVTPAAAEPEPVAAAEKAQIDSIVEGKAQLKVDDLLPQYDDANEFAKQNPVSKLLKEQNFLVSGYHVGVNTVMQSNKIPYHDIRSVPPIVKENVGPFLQSSYEVPAGSGRRMLEIGM